MWKITAYNDFRKSTGKLWVDEGFTKILRSFILGLSMTTEVKGERGNFHDNKKELLTRLFYALQMLNVYLCNLIRMLNIKTSLLKSGEISRWAVTKFFFAPTHSKNILTHTNDENFPSHFFVAHTNTTTLLNEQKKVM